MRELIRAFRFGFTSLLYVAHRKWG
ncbi:hypothetical protein HYPGJ_20993 [Hyphomicrobium sp. GJ21]|nr:hypothetical protein HYPGJ_20993 [Hyphomicrobium sp. GJ21]